MNEREKAIVNLAIERAEQACRYTWKHQDMEDSEYAKGFEIACGVCEKAIREAVMQHIEADVKELGDIREGADG